MDIEHRDVEADESNQHTKTRKTERLVLHRWKSERPGFGGRHVLITAIAMARSASVMNPITLVAHPPEADDGLQAAEHDREDDSSDTASTHGDASCKCPLGSEIRSHYSNARDEETATSKPDADTLSEYQLPVFCANASHHEAEDG